MIKRYKKSLFISSILLLLCGAFSVFAQAGLELQYPVIMGKKINWDTQFPDFIKYIYYLSLTLSLFIVFGSTLFAGLRYIASAGKPMIMANAKDQIYAGILGTIILFSSFLILNTINPDLLILKEFTLEEKTFTFTPLPERAGLTIPAEEYPLGVLINGRFGDNKFYSTSQGLTHEKRIDRLETVAKKTEEVVETLLPLIADLEEESEILKNYSEILKNETEELIFNVRDCRCSNCNRSCNGCGCQNTGCSCSQCAGDPCPNRGSIEALRASIPAAQADVENQEPIVEEKRIIVNLFATAFKSFTEKNNKVDAFIEENLIDINEHLSIDLQKLIYEMSDLENTTTTTHTLSNNSSFTTPSFYYGLKYKPEEEENDIESNRRYFDEVTYRIEESRAKIKECSDKDELMWYNSFHEWKNSTERIDIIEELTVVHRKEGDIDILPGSDPATFYCSEYQPKRITVREKTVCETEVPIGEVVDEAQYLAQKILNEFSIILDSNIQCSNSSIAAAAAGEESVDEAALEREKITELIFLSKPGADRNNDCVDNCLNVPCTCSCECWKNGKCDCKVVGSGKKKKVVCKTFYRLYCGSCTGEAPYSVEKINPLYDNVISHNNRISDNHETIKTIYENIRDTYLPDTQTSCAKINSEIPIGTFTVKEVVEGEIVNITVDITLSEKIAKIEEKLVKSRLQLEEWYTPGLSINDYYAEKIILKTLINCEVAKRKEFGKDELVQNCYGFDIDTPHQTDNFLCCNSEFY